MLQLIDRLRKKPKKTRKKIAVGISTLITFFIFVFWVSSIPSRMEEKTYATVSPFENLKSNVASAYDSVKEIFSNIGGSEEDTNSNIEVQ